MKKICKEGMVFFAVCILLFFVKNQYTPYLMTKSTYGMPALIEKGKIDNLYIGSSMFRQGLDIGVMNESHDEEHYILAYNGNQPVLECFQLEYLLENDVKIKRLFIDMYVYSAFEEPDLDDEKMLMEIGLGDKIKLAQLIQMDTWEECWRMFVSSNNELILTWPLNGFIINSQFKQGGTLTQGAGTTKEYLQSAAIPDVGDVLNDKQRQAITEIVDLANENDIELYFVETPKYKKLANNDMYIGAMREYALLLNELDVSMVLHDKTFEALSSNDTKEVAKVYSFDFEEAGYYSDLYHLSCQGRCEFTKNLLKVLH